MRRMIGYLKAIESMAVLRLDSMRWHRQLGRLRQSASPRARGKILFCDVVGSYAVSKAQSLYAVALRQLGYDSVVLLDRPNAVIERNYRSAGVTEFYYLENLSPDPETRRGRAETLLSEYDDLNDLLSLEIDGVRVGRNVLSKTVRQFRVGRLDNGDAAHRAAVADYLCQSLAAAEGARSMMKEGPFKAAFFCERGYTPAGEVFDVCTLAGADAIQWVAAPMDGTHLFKRYRTANRAMHPLSLSDQSWRAASGMPWRAQQDEQLLDQLRSHYQSGAWYNRQQLQTGKRIKTVSEVHRELGLDPAKKTAVIFCHILYDATFFYGTSLFPDYQSWLVETVRCAIANPSLNWVIKAHPVNVWRSRMDGVAVEPLELNVLQAAFGGLPDHVRFMAADTPINTYSLFEVADFGLTVRGTIGLELPCFGIPVVTAGTGRYSGRGFTIDPDTPQAYRALLAGLQERERLDEATVNRARRYAHATLRWRPMPLTSMEFQFGLKSRTLKSNVWLSPACPPDLTTAPDIWRMASWAVEGDEEDLLAPGADRFVAPRVAEEDDPSVFASDIREGRSE